MNPEPLKPHYPFEPIGTIDALARVLGVDSGRLVAIATNADRLYRLAKPIIKADGSIRQPFDALPPLKEIHRALKVRVLVRVRYPSYLTGSLVGRDYRANAGLHAGSKIVMCEDVRDVFPSITVPAVRDVWQRLFQFPPRVAELLTQICTKDGALPQGAIPSSYIANLVLWRFEPDLHARLAAGGLVYSRYVDDIVVSSKRSLTKDDQTQVVGAVYGMLAKAGLRAKRRKHERFTASQRMVTTKLVVNRRAALPKEMRAKIRASVHRVELLSQAGLLDAEGLRLQRSVAVRVGQLGRFHPRLAVQLKERLSRARRRQGEVEQRLSLTEFDAHSPLESMNKPRS